MGSSGIISLLKKRLQEKLPGEEAQFRMTPRTRVSVDVLLEQNPDHRKSAVILNLFPKQDELYTLVIRRNEYDGNHSGQLALPGGKMDERDTDLMSTAIREMKEEVGVSVDRSQIIGMLTPIYIPVSNFLVQPFVAVHEAVPAWKPDPSEVNEILELPLLKLIDDSNKDRRRIHIRKDMFIEAPCYLVNDSPLWGATAMMFSEMEALLMGR